jgi:hypothetical protein
VLDTRQQSPIAQSSEHCLAGFGLRTVRGKL